MTYNMCRCRFGSRMRAYIKTKWLSYKYNIPFFYQPLEYSDQSMIRKIEKKYDKEIEKYFSKVIFFGKDPNIIINRNAKYIYAGDYYTNVKIDFNDKQFMNKLKKTIAPINPIERTHIPSDRISVAVHVRRGGGYDPPLSFEKESLEKTHVDSFCPEKFLTNKDFADQTSYLCRACNEKPMQVNIRKDEAHNPSPLYEKESFKETYADIIYPGKFLPDEYFINQIRKLYKTCNKKPMHVHIFTDDKNPSRFIEKYKKALQSNNITFSSRTPGDFETSVIDDFFSMAYYDCLIMPNSGFSWCVKQILANFFIVISFENNGIVVEVNQKNSNKVEKYIGKISNLNFEVFNQDNLLIS